MKRGFWRGEDFQRSIPGESAIWDLKEVLGITWIRKRKTFKRRNGDLEKKAKLQGCTNTQRQTWPTSIFYLSLFLHSLTMHNTTTLCQTRFFTAQAIRPLSLPLTSRTGPWFWVPLCQTYLSPSFGYTKGHLTSLALQRQKNLSHSLLGSHRYPEYWRDSVNRNSEPQLVDCTSRSKGVIRTMWKRRKESNAISLILH